MEKKMYICPKAKECDLKSCFHAEAHMHQPDEATDPCICIWAKGDKYTCIPYLPQEPPKDGIGEAGKGEGESMYKSLEKYMCSVCSKRDPEFSAQCGMFCDSFRLAREAILDWHNSQLEQAVNKERERIADDIYNWYRNMSVGNNPEQPLSPEEAFYQQTVQGFTDKVIEIVKHAQHLEERCLILP